MSAAEGFRVDMHVKVLDEGVLRRAKARDMDALVYAPHFTPLPEIERRAAAYTDEELLVVPAREIFTGDWHDRKHLLAIGLDSPVPDFITPEGALLELRGQDAAALVPHPEFLTVSLDRADVERYRSLLDGTEIYNPKFWPHHARRAASIAEEASLPAFASSYAHLGRSVGEAWTTFDRADVEPGPSSTRSGMGRPDGGWLVDRTWSDRVEAFVGALTDGVSRSVSRRTGLTHRLRCLAEFAHLGYENSLPKAVRLFRPQLPGTHPGRPLYDGRFDDVRVY